MYDRDGITQNDILKIKDIPCKGRIVLSEYIRNYEGVDYIKTLKPGKKANGALFTDADWFGLKTFEKQFDFVKFLNH